MAQLYVMYADISSKEKKFHQEDTDALFAKAYSEHQNGLRRPYAITEFVRENSFAEYAQHWGTLPVTSANTDVMIATDGGVTQCLTKTY